MENGVYLSKNIVRIIAVIIVLGVFFAIISIRDALNEPISSSASKTLVTNPSRFYTVTSCIDKYLLYLENQNAKNLYTLLNQEYIEKNILNEQNVLEHLKNYGNGLFTINARKMYEKKISETVHQYFVAGYVEQNLFGEIGTSVESYFVVTLYEEELTFSIEPSTKEIFGQGVK